MADTRGCMLLLRESQHALTPKERSVARYILANPNNVVNMNIGVLARQCGVSIASVVRFCKDLGFSGYKELIRLVGELPAGFRTVFNMYVVEGYSHKEIGEALGISENTSRSQLQRARTLLQSKIRSLTDDR